jgi:hypothetical protein
MLRIAGKRRRKFMAILLAALILRVRGTRGCDFGAGGGAIVIPSGARDLQNID